MSDDQKNRILAEIESSTEYSEDEKQVIRDIYKLSRAEGFASLVQSGIYSPGGKLMPQYKSERR
jgi:hypothetical protein